jgi:hypothetical protein
MKNKNYYPLRIGLAGSIVSDIRTTPEGQTSGHSETWYYGGYLVAESIPSQDLAQQLVDAYNEKHGPEQQPDDNNLLGKLLDIKVELLRGPHPNETPNAFTVRVEERINIAMNHVQFGNWHEPIRTKYPPPDASEDYMDINSPPGTKVTVSEKSIRNGTDYNKDTARIHLKVGDIYTVDMTQISAWYTDVWVNEFPGIRFNSVQFVKYPHSAFDTELLNKRKEEIEDAVRIQNDIKFQIDLIDMLYNERKEMNRGGSKTLLAIKENLLAIKRWREGPVMKDIDCETVIEDLLDLAKSWARQLNFYDKDVQRKVAIQNAEAALGMLRALKEKRETPRESWAEDAKAILKKHPISIPVVEDPEYTSIVMSFANALPFTTDINKQISYAVVGVFQQLSIRQKSKHL